MTGKKAIILSLFIEYYKEDNMPFKKLDNLVYPGFKAVKKSIMQQIQSISKIRNIHPTSNSQYNWKLKDILEPKMFELVNNDGNFLRIVSKCESGKEERFSTLENIIQAVSGDYIAICRKHYDDITLEISSQTGRHAVSTKLYAKGPNGDLFAISYVRNTDTKSGAVYADIFKPFAEDPELAAGLFMSVWENALIKSTKTDLDGSLHLYGGDIRMEDIGGYSLVKDKVKKEVIIPFVYQNKLESIISKTQINPKINKQRAVLFYGPPGTGKTMMAKALANESGINFLYMDMSQVFSKFYSESPKLLQESIEKAEKYAKENGKTILFLDEIDYFGARSRGSSTDAEDSRVIDVLLTKLDGLESQGNDNLLIIGATNNYDLLDPALMSRFRSKLFFDKPNLEDRYSIFKMYTKNLTDEEIKELAAASDGLVGRDISSIAYNAASDFLSDSLEGKTKGELPDKSYYMRLIKSQNAQVKTGEKGMYS